MKCPQCGFEDNGNFCSNCGASLQNKTLSKTEPMPTNKKKITLTFGKSTSKNYDIAVNRAMKHHSYEEVRKGNDLIHKITLEMNEINELKSLLDLVGNWKSTTIYVNDQAVPYSEIAQVLYCYSEREKAYNPKEYCYGRDDAKTYNDNELGCRHCGVNPYAWQGLEDFGQMQKDGTFIIDKNKLIHTVNRNLEKYIICPALDIQAIEKKLKDFPASINPRKDKEWEYVTEYDDGKEIAVSVRKKDPKKGSGYVTKDYRKDSNDEMRSSNNNKSAKTGGGCLLPIVIILSAVLLMAWHSL